MRGLRRGSVIRQLALVAALLACAFGLARAGLWAGGPQQPKDTAADTPKAEKLSTATFGSGCFWCTEAVFERVKGVVKVVSGYSGGIVENPTYQQVCSGQTGHAEAVQITFDPAVITYADLLEIFWKTHDPTTPNEQGPDRGTQYRSAVFYHDDAQKKTAEAYKQQLNESKAFEKPIVTEITAYTNFFAAEKYHQDYFELNRRARYCKDYISPKIKKFNRMFREKLKDDAAKEQDVRSAGAHELGPRKENPHADTCA